MEEKKEETEAVREAGGGEIEERREGEVEDVVGGGGREERVSLRARRIAFGTSSSVRWVVGSQEGREREEGVGEGVGEGMGEEGVGGVKVG